MTTLADEYYQAQSRTAEVIFDFRAESQNHAHCDIIDVPLIAEGTATASQGVEDAFVVAQLLSEEECDDLVKLGEEVGLVPPNRQAGSLRQAKRTDNWKSDAISSLIYNKIGGVLSEKMTEASSSGRFHGFHDNWRILRYDAGESFPAHQDQMDSIQLLDESTGKKDLVVSSHTLIINLSQNGLQGGATRFYPLCKLASRDLGQYDHAVDVFLPRGWAVAFPQIGMVHAGQPVSEESDVPKYIAQAGLLRVLPRSKVLRPSVFRHGPGLQGSNSGSTRKISK